MAIVISGVNNNDKITAADGTIDLLSGVSYASTITAPAFTTPGNLTAGHLNIGSGIQLGNAGVATATTFVGNLTGNVNATSNLLLQIGGSEKFRVGGSGQLGIGGANYGTSGQVLTSGGSGSAATWSTVTGTTINNNATTKFITGTNNANELDCEANLSYNNSLVTFSSSSLMVDKGTNATISVKETAGNKETQFRANTDGGLLRTIGNYPLILGTNQLERVHIKGGGGLVSSKGGTIAFSDGYSAIEARAPEGTTQITVTNSTYEAGPSYDNEAGIWFKGNYSGSNERAKSAIIHKNIGDYGVGSLHLCVNNGYDNSNASYSDRKMTITKDGKVGINSTTPQQTLDVKGSINGGTSNQPFLRFFDSHARQRTTKHYFKCIRGGTTIFDIITVDLNDNFHQALIILYYGARLQGIADATTYPVHKIIGVNKFNGGSINFDKQVIQQSSNAQSHGDIDAVATSSSQYRIRLTFSGSTGGSSFCCGSVEIIGVGSDDDGAFYSLGHGHGLTA